MSLALSIQHAIRMRQILSRSKNSTRYRKCTLVLMQTTRYSRQILIK